MRIFHLSSCFHRRVITVSALICSVTIGSARSAQPREYSATIERPTDKIMRRYDLSKVTNIRSTYRYVKSRLQRNDARIRTQVFSKYGKKERNRVQPLLHTVSKRIVKEAKTRQHGIVMERLTEMRRLYRRGSGNSGNNEAG